MKATFTTTKGTKCENMANLIQQELVERYISLLTDYHEQHSNKMTSDSIKEQATLIALLIEPIRNIYDEVDNEARKITS